MRIKNYTDKTKIIKIITLTILLTTLLIATLNNIKPMTANAETKEYIHNISENEKTSDYFDIQETEKSTEPTEPTEPTESTKSEETEANLATIQDSINILIAVQMVTLGAFLGYVAISRLM